MRPRARGDERVDLAACGFDTRSPSGLDLAGFSALPDAVHVRTMAAGSFEAITKRLGVLHALDRMGVRVVNAPRAIEACVDKSMTSFLVARAGLPTPATWTVESFEQARALVRREIDARAAGAEAAVRRAGQGLAPHPRGRTTCRRPRRRRASIICSASNRSRPRISAISGFSSRAGG